MKIAVVADDSTLDSSVAKRFATGKYLLIVTMPDMQVTVLENPGDASGQVFANEVVKQGCEAVITGTLMPEAFELLVTACITRYYGVGHTVKEALCLMEDNALKLIKNYEGTDQCTGTYH